MRFPSERPADTANKAATEWEKYKSPIVACVHRRRFDRIWREESAAHDARQKRQEALRPLFGRLQPPKRSATSARASIPISFAIFLALPTVETLWYPANAFIDARGWPPLEPQILSEICTRIRLDKVVLFDRIVRAHVADNGVLPSTTMKPIASSSSSPFIDCDPSKGLVPLHAALTDRDMDPLFAQVTSLFRCGICSTKLPYPDIAIHLVDDHDVPNVPAYAHVPSSDFRKAIKSLLDDLGHSLQLELAAFEFFYADCDFDVTMRSASGQFETSVGETWAQVVRSVLSLLLLALKSSLRSLTCSSPANRPPNSTQAASSSRTQLTATSSGSSFRPPASATRTRSSTARRRRREGGRRLLSIQTLSLVPHSGLRDVGCSSSHPLLQSSSQASLTVRVSSKAHSAQGTPNSLRDATRFCFAWQEG